MRTHCPSVTCAKEGSSLCLKLLTRQASQTQWECRPAKVRDTGQAVLCLHHHSCAAESCKHGGFPEQRDAPVQSGAVLSHTTRARRIKETARSSTGSVSQKPVGGNPLKLVLAKEQEMIIESLLEGQRMLAPTPPGERGVSPRREAAGSRIFPLQHPSGPHSNLPHPLAHPCVFFPSTRLDRQRRPRTRHRARRAEAASFPLSAQ